MGFKVSDSSRFKELMIVLFIAALTHSTLAPDLPPLIGGRSNIYRHKNASTTHFSTIITPYRSQEPLNINSVTLSKATIPIYEPQVLTLDMTATFDNPFDAKDIEVRLDVTQIDLCHCQAPVVRLVHPGSHVITKF